MPRIRHAACQFTSMIGIATMLVTSLSSSGCEEPADIADLEGDEERFSSYLATLMNFEFDGQFTTSSTANLNGKIQQQLLYTIGHLNWNRSVGRLDKAITSNIQTTALGGGLYQVSYHALLPVAWGSKTNLPTTYDFTLPKRVDSSALQTFATNYSTTCVDGSAHDVDSGSMWYYYRPQRSSCALVEEDIVRLTATATRSDENTTGKYPEYHKVWEDETLDIVAIFGKYEDGAIENNDAGIAAYNRFYAQMRTTLGTTGLTTIPAEATTNPGIAFPDITFSKTLADGRSVNVTLLLVDNVRTAGPTFDDRYDDLSADADLIFYNGHAGLGSNTRALAQKGTIVPGKYQIFFMNGCDTFAYVDTALTQKKSQANPDDPNGTKYLDMVTNAMPSYFSQMSGASNALIRGLMQPLSAPSTYDQMFRNISSSQVVLVTGEEDNVFYPGYDPEVWAGMEETGTVAWRQMLQYQTPELGVGTYRFTLAPGSANDPGDADLYVKLGSEPSRTDFDCQSAGADSNEECVVELTAPATIHVGVRGFYRRGSAFVLNGTQE